MMELYFHSLMRLNCILLKQLKTGATFPFFFLQPISAFTWLYSVKTFRFQEYPERNFLPRGPVFAYTKIKMFCTLRTASPHRVRVSYKSVSPSPAIIMQTSSCYPTPWVLPTKTSNSSFHFRRRARTRMAKIYHKPTDDVRGSMLSWRILG
jgi:hypothetical protein